jgi:hypothetical protein
LLPILPWLSYKIIAGIGQLAKDPKPPNSIMEWFAKLAGHIAGLVVVFLFSIPALVYEYLLQPIASIYWGIIIIYFLALLGWLLFKKPSTPADH